MATYDNGKVCPNFGNKIIRTCSLPHIPNMNPDLEQNWGGHTDGSLLTVQNLGVPKYIPYKIRALSNESPTSGVTPLRLSGFTFQTPTLVKKMARSALATWP
ncbi:MAG: hypothetical protein OXC63_04620 [Aestuariivita sp.]|nr:hypothetical protein [Aestuariivita sp.]MCY4345308.1 hypothetical protein [Aestuariivita sp.]